MIAFILLLSWFLMLKKHKYQNKLQLAAVGIATLFSIGNIFQPSNNILFLQVAWCVFSLGILFEEVRVIRRDWLFTRDSKLHIYKYEDLEELNVGSPYSTENISNIKTYQNSRSMNFKCKIENEKPSRSHISDFDIHLTVLKGTLYISTLEKEVELHRGEIWKVPAFSTRSLRGSKNTEFSATVIKI